MGLSFLTPVFLAGSLLLVIPIVIHLIHREKKETVHFPSLMFLRRIPYRSVRRQKIRHWLLLLLRATALLLLAAAFARPFLGRNGEASAAAVGAREVVLLLDRSYSMAYGDRWSRAVRAAREAIGGAGPEDRVSLVLFDERAEAMNLPTSDRTHLEALLARAEPGSGKTRFAPALKMARKILEESKLGRGEVVLITDFQKVGWDDRDEVSLPEGASLRTIDLSDRQTANVSVASLALERDYVSGRERVVASARLANKGVRPFPRTRVSLELNGRALQVKEVDLEPNSSALVSFAPFILPEGSSQGMVRIGDDALAADNRFHFVLSPGEAIRVTILEGSGSRSQQSLYLTRALGLGDRPSFRTRVKKGRLTSEDLAASQVVFLNEAALPASGSVGELKRWVEGGRGLVVALGATGRWSEETLEILPALPGGTVDRTADWGGTLAYVDRNHPIFEIFSRPHSGDFSAARFFRYRSVAASEGVSARFDDGAPALLERRLGEGTVMVWTSTFDAFWNDLELKPVFLPFVHQLVTYAGGFSESRPWFTVGEALDTEKDPTFAGMFSGARSATSDTGQDWVLAKPSGEKVAFGRGEGRPVLVFDEQGFYELRELGPGRIAPRPIAVNLDPSESDLSSLDPEELAAAVLPRGGGAVNGSFVAPSLEPRDQERRQSFWWYLLGGAFIALVGETALANRLSRLAR